MPIPNPRSWEVLPFGDLTAFMDFLGSHDLVWRSLNQQIRVNLAKPTYPVLPLGDYTGAEWHDADQLVHEGACTALGIPLPPDFRSYDLTDKDQFASWTWLHAQDMVRIAQAAGL